MRVECQCEMEIRVRVEQEGKPGDALGRKKVKYAS